MVFETLLYDPDEFAQERSFLVSGPTTPMHQP
jgi:hypothetical protein